MTMKTAVSARYGPPDLIEIRQTPKPEPKADEVLVKVHATTVSRSDCGMLRAHPFFVRPFTGLRRPNCTVLGMDFAGTVTDVGVDVTSYSVGDRVFGLSPSAYGAHAEYLCVPETGPISLMPEGARFGDVVACEGVWYANSNLKAFGLKPGHRILVYGASGAIGVAAVQLAKFYGAEVTAVVATQHMELAKSLGANRVIDYTAEDFTAIGATFDFVLDAVGKTSFFRCRKLLTPTGTFAATDLGPWYQNLLLSLWSSITSNRRVIFPLPKESVASVDFLKARMEAGEFHAIVDRHYPLEDIVEAYRYVETAQKTGIVVIDVTSADAN